MKFKRFLALALSLLMVFGGAASIFAADDDATTEAEEVTAVSPYQAAIDALKVLGIFKGDDNGDSADKAVNRWQMALFVSRALTGEIDDAYWGKTAYDYSKFTDVTGTSSLYLGAIGFANQKGIILGYDDPATGKSIFNPDGGITYQDALTMATRTLGFTGLAYPWGVIEKAIDLELTKGLVDVGYQDELTRGEVAQIVYNMLIAKVLGADGKYWTLKDKAFGIEEAVVVIVAADQVRYTLDNEVTKRDNYVSFQILGEDGKVTDPVYSMKASDFGIDSDEDLNSYVGYSYSVATSNDFASFVSCEMNPTVTYWNLGKTTKGTEFTATKFNEGKTNEYTKLVVVNPDDAKDTTDNYSIVEDYTTLRTIQGAKTGVEQIPGDNELLAYDPSVASSVVTNEGSGYYTSPEGHILTIETVWDTTLGKYVNSLTVKYYYNVFTKSYFKTNDVSTYTVNGITYYGSYYVPVSDEDVAKLKVGYKTEDKWSFGQLTKLSNISSTYAYASLSLIDDYRAYEGYDRAIYKAYGLGQVVTSDKDGDGNLRTKINTPTGIVAEKVTVLDRKTSETDLSKAPPTFVDAVTGKKLDTPKDGAWILYYYNGMTNTVEVLETLTVEKGVLTGWTIANKTVTIGNEKFPANYDTLKNNGIAYTARTTTSGTYTDDSIKVKNNQELYKLFQRGVNYIVLDGEVVWIEANASVSKGVVVLHSVIGITSDGMIEYYAYTTNNPGSLQKIKVNAINNSYFGTGYTAYASLLASSTVKGDIYRIAAIDSDGVYYLSTAGFDDRTLTFDTYYRGVFDASVQVNGMSDPITSVTLASDTYYVFVNPDTNEKIITAKGNPALPTLGTTLSIIGDYYWASSKMIVAEVTDTASWSRIKTYFNSTANIAYYYAPTGTTNYPVASTGTDAVGSAVITYAKLINIVTGKTEDVVTTNIPATVGGTYRAEDGVIVARVSNTTANTVWNQVVGAYDDMLVWWGNNIAIINNNTQYVYGGTVTVDYTPNFADKARYENLRTAFLAEINGNTSTNPRAIPAGNTNIIVQNAKDVTFRTLDNSSSSAIVISSTSNADAITGSTTKKTYTIEYFFNTTTGAVAAYITKVADYVAPAVVSTAVDTLYNNATSIKADITINNNTITWNYNDSSVANASFNPSNVKMTGITLQKSTSSGWVSVTTDLTSFSTVALSTGARVTNGKAVITLNDSINGGIPSLTAGKYRLVGLEITTDGGTHSFALAAGTGIEFTIN